MLELCTLASGSSGNSLLVTDGRTHVLVDAGISCRRICTGLKELGVEPTELAGVLITHEHSDHISGLTTLTKQLRLPVYASPGTGRQLCYRIAFLEELLRPVAPGEGFSIGGLAIESFPTSHDAAESVGYALSAGGRKAAVVTDLGYVTVVGEAEIRLRPHPAGSPVAVTLGLDANGVICGEVFDLIDNVKVGEIQIRRQANMNDDEVEQHRRSMAKINPV